MKKEEKLEMLEEAQNKMYDVIDLIEEAIQGSKHQANTEAYLLDHLKIMTSSDHGFLSDDLNLDDLKTQIEDGE